MATGNIKTSEEVKVTDGYSPDGEEKKVWTEYTDRKSELQDSRNSINGLDIDDQMREWDRKYFAETADIPASEMDANKSPIPLNTAYGKIQTVLSILVDNNPEVILEEEAPMYSANRELMKRLAEKSFRDTNSLGQFKLSVHNMAKRGWFIGRTYNRVISTTNKVLTQVDASGKETYETYKNTHMDDVAYTNISNYNAWLDEETRPEDYFSTRDWMWREVWHIDDLREAFPKDQFPNMDHVGPGGDVSETPDGDSSQAYTSNESSTASKKNLVEVYFYENYRKDWFIIEANGVMIVWEPLPQHHKRLSCVYGYWHLRNDDNIYGIGVVEEMDKDEEMAVRIMNMTLRQLLLTIAPPGFYTGTEDPEDENMVITPGVLRRTLDPKNITWLKIPEGNGQGLEAVGYLQDKQDAKTGITKAIEGAPDKGGRGSSDTAFEIGVDREAGLKRLKLPLRTIQAALNWEFQNRIALIQQVYSDFDVEHVADEEMIMKYMEEVDGDREFYFIENEGTPGYEKFFKKNYRQVKLGLEVGDDGEFVESDDNRFFKISPKMLSFRGMVHVELNSIMVNSEELEKQDTLRMSNVLLPIFAEGNPEVQGPAVKQILESFQKDPKKWLPLTWQEQMGIIKKETQEGVQEGEELPEAAANAIPNTPPTDEAPGTVVPQSDLASNPSFSSRAGAAFNAFRNPS